MMLGLFDLFDQVVAEVLGVDVDTYINKIESLDEEDMNFIIEGALSGDVEQENKARELFNSK